MSRAATADSADQSPSDSAPAETPSTPLEGWQVITPFYGARGHWRTYLHFVEFVEARNRQLRMLRTHCTVRASYMRGRLPVDL